MLEETPVVLGDVILDVSKGTFDILAFRANGNVIALAVWASACGQRRYMANAGDLARRHRLLYPFPLPPDPLADTATIGFSEMSFRREWRGLGLKVAPGLLRFRGCYVVVASARILWVIRRYRSLTWRAGRRSFGGGEQFNRGLGSPTERPARGGLGIVPLTRGDALSVPLRLGMYRPLAAGAFSFVDQGLLISHRHALARWKGWRGRRWTLVVRRCDVDMATDLLALVDHVE